MATEFLHLPKILLHGTPARERGPHAQAGTNESGFLSPGAPTHMLCRTLDAGNARCSVGQPSQTATGAEPKTGSEGPSSTTCNKNDYGTSRSGFQT